MNKKEFGDYGEQVATDYLLKKGYKVLDRNYRAMGTEIDIVCLYGDIIVFVEVKSRRTKTFGNAFEAVDERKIHNIIQTAMNYLMRFDYTHLQVRFDVIEYYSFGEINHIENAFEVI